ncbi:hypothetical protein LX95_01423 [Mesonia algae]|uniref:Lipoprotein n=1 Tax=Mesonia algae TaxID=213248 RepID=A0A2W7K2A1_9FLAO|nr:hypothetical protein [Mesonia algae]PZW41740.1 hypothetical protein LX95_01423 [Mesonia algae]
MKRIFYITIFMLVTSCIKISFETKNNASEKLLPSEAYLNKVSDTQKAKKSKFYYVSKASSPDFINNMEASLISFTKNKQSTSIDKILVKDENGNEIPLNTCDNFTAIDNSDIENFLSNEKTYEGIVLKSIESQKLYDFPKNKTTTIILYTKKMDGLQDKYINLAKHLYKEENIDYIFISMDLENLKNIPDIWEETIF